MNMGGLSAFIATYENGSITKAAKQLYMSPQGLSKSISRLEQEMRVQLFVRSSAGATPTEYAKTLYPKAKSLVDTVAEMRTDAERREPSYSLSVVLSDGMISYLGLDFISEFENGHPGIDLRIHECSNRAVEDFLLAEEAEIGFLVGPVNEDAFTCTFFQSVPHVLIVSDESVLAQKDRIAFSDLEGQMVFHLGCDYPVGSNLRERLDAAGVKPAATIGVVGADTILQHVIRDEGVLVSAEEWARLSQRPGLRILPFEDKSFAWNVFFAQKKGVALSVQAQEFASFIFEWRDGLRRLS